MSLTTQLKGYYKKGKDIALNAPEIERKVKDATSNDKWGPSGTQMQEISRATTNFHDFPIIMGVIWKRINDPGKYWRHVYKSLLLIDYLIRNGSEQVIRDCRAHLIEVQTLTEFQYIEEDKDVGLSVRERAKQVIDLLQDDKRIRQERDKAKVNRDKYIGRGNEGGSQYGGFEGGGYGGYGNDSGYGGGYGGNDRYGGYGNDGRGGYGNDSRGGYGNDSRYGNEGRYGGEGRYSDDNYDRRSGNGSERDYGYERDEYKDDRYSRPDEDASSYRRDDSRDLDSGDRQVAPSKTTAPPSTTTRSRPRAPSGGEAQPQPAKTLLAIDDLNTPAPPPQSASDSLFEAFQQPTQGFGQSEQFGAFQSSGSGGFGEFAPTSNVSSDFFNPRAGEQTEWSEFHGSSTSSNFNPFDQQAPSAHEQQIDHVSEPNKNDPWSKKDLFNLDSLNLGEKEKGKSVAPGVSPSKTPMAAQASKAPMVANKPVVSSGPTIRPTVNQPPMGFAPQGGGGGLGQSGQPGAFPPQFGQPQVGFGYTQPMGPMGRGVPPGAFVAQPPPMGYYGQTPYMQPAATQPGFGQPFQPRQF